MSETTETTACHYADGERLPLAPSTRFVAVRATPGEADDLSARSAATSPDPHLVVFRVDDAAAATAMPSGAWDSSRGSRALIR